MLISVVIPVFNSAQILPELCRQIHAAFSILAYHYELILVNDGSTDHSWQVIQTLKQSGGYPIIGINKYRNTGQHNALYTGLLHAKGEYLITIDDDLQFSPADIPQLIATQQQSGADLVYGSPEMRHHSSPRNIASRMALYTFSLLLGTHPHGSPFRLFSASLFNPALPPPPIMFVDGIISPKAKKITAVAVNHYPRKAGVSGHKLHIQALWP